MAKKKVEPGLQGLLAARLQAFLKETRMSVKTFADKAKVSTATIYQIQGGKVPGKMTVGRVEGAMREWESHSFAELPKLDPVHQGILEVILEEALTKKVLDRLIQHVLRETDEAGADKMRHVAESLVVAHLARFGGKDMARELLALHAVIRGE